MNAQERNKLATSKHTTLNGGFIHKVRRVNTDADFFVYHNITGALQKVQHFYATKKLFQRALLRSHSGRRGWTRSTPSTARPLQIPWLLQHAGRVSGGRQGPRVLPDPGGTKVPGPIRASVTLKKRDPGTGLCPVPPFPHSREVSLGYYVPQCPFSLPPYSGGSVPAGPFGRSVPSGPWGTT